MKPNMGATDRLGRLVLAGLGVWLAAAVGYGSAGGVIVLVLAGILTATAAVGVCPLYSVLRISTRHGLRRLAHGH